MQGQELYEVLSIHDVQEVNIFNFFCIFVHSTFLFLRVNRPRIEFRSIPDLNSQRNEKGHNRRLFADFDNSVTHILYLWSYRAAKWSIMKIYYLTDVP